MRYQKQYRMGVRRLVPSIGTRRRLQGLMWMGHRLADIADQLGTSQRSLSNAFHLDMVRADRAAAVIVLFDEWHMVPGPSKQTSTKAKKKGWLPPLAWDEEQIDDPDVHGDLGPKPKGLVVDENAVHLVLSGQRVRVNLHERRELLATLCKQDLTAAQISERIGCSSATVDRYRKVAREVGH